MMAILALSWLGSTTAWVVMESAGRTSPVLRVVFFTNLVFHPTLFLVVWRRWWPMRAVDATCLGFAVVTCAACMALRLYWPEVGASIDLQPLYLWIPVIYVFTFTLLGHRNSLLVSLCIWAGFLAISAPYLASHATGPFGNFTIQLHTVSAVLIAALHFFSSYQPRFHAARLSADELARMANTDDLTRLANRRRMMETIEQELLRFRQYGHEFAVILFDVDHFKLINDRFGHGTGDDTLVALAGRSLEVLDDVDALGRWGGEEFVVVLPETGYEQAMRKAAALCRHVAAKPLLDSGHPVTVSCGVTVSAPGDSADNLLHRADEALYDAKRSGRNGAKGRRDESPWRLATAAGET